MGIEADSGSEPNLRQILERRRARLKREIDAVDVLLECISSEAFEAPSDAPEVPTSSASTEYRSLKPQEAVLKLLRDNPGKRFRASAAAKKLKRLGVRSASKTFSSLIAAALKRLAERGVAIRELEGKRPVYSLKLNGSESGVRTAESQ